MIIKSKCVRSTRSKEFCNSTVNRLTHYSNILAEQSEFINDNGIKDFSLVDSSKKVQMMRNYCD